MRGTEQSGEEPVFPFQPTQNSSVTLGKLLNTSLSLGVRIGKTGVKKVLEEDFPGGQGLVFILFIFKAFSSCPSL